MLLSPTPAPADAFVWYPLGRTFIAEISDLGPAFRFGQVWDDSCDEGFTLVSRYPGRDDIVFAVDHVERSEGDTLYWDLKAADQRQRGFSVRIFND